MQSATISLLGSQPMRFARSALAAPHRPAARRCCVVAAASGTPPKGVTQPPTQPVAQKPLFGLVDNAERWNSRAAMIGFFALLLVEGISGRGILDLLGVATGKGLSIGF